MNGVLLLLASAALAASILEAGGAPYPKLFFQRGVNFTAKNRWATTLGPLRPCSTA